MARRETETFMTPRTPAPLSCRRRALRTPSAALIVAAAALAGPALLPDPARAQDEAPAMGEAIDAPYFVAWVEGYVRAQPTADAERLATLPFGTRVAVTGQTEGGDWLRVELPDGTTGYVWAEVLRPARVALGGGIEGAPEDGADGVGVDDAASDDNTQDTAVPIGPLTETPQTFDGTIGPADSVDMYSFTVDDWTEASIYLFGLSADADMSLLAADGTVVAESLNSADSDESITTPVGPGTYTIEVYQFEGETGYTLEVSGVPGAPPPPDEAGDTLETARDLGLVQDAAEVEGFIAPGQDDLDYIAFELAERSRVVVTLSGLTADADISLDDADGYELVNSMVGGSADERIETALDAGRYYLRIYPFDGATDYLARIEVTPTGAKPTVDQ
jgi:hypothetical protein